MSATRLVAVATVVAGFLAQFAYVAVASAQPFQHQATVIIPANRSSNSARISVPAGKRLVIEHASLAVTVPTGSGQNASVSIWTETGGARIEHLLAPAQNVGVPDLVAATVVDRMVTSHPIKLYGDPGTRVEFFARRHGQRSGSVNAVISISGQLVTP